MALLKNQKKYGLGKFYKETVQNISYFNKKKIFLVTNKQKIDNKTFYQLKNTRNQRYFNKRLQRHG